MIDVLEGERITHAGKVMIAPSDKIKGWLCFYKRPGGDWSACYPNFAKEGTRDWRRQPAPLHLSRDDALSVATAELGPAGGEVRLVEVWM